MANLKSSKKNVLTSEKRRKNNLGRKSEIKTLAKKVLDALAANNIELAKEMLRATEAKVARATGKRVIKKNTGMRKVSRLAKKVAAAQK
ncbi:MAG: 30S ribosomal protein S20 [bacterium]